ncbi:pyridoxal phosphate-dependent transferase [Cercophora scortea]|uniref:Pyridoxal phosphate-dependent transferase n=1 Tax=Cercophora scortea TaxID=314031 RepID=A0AAE0MDA1_9PEZI|nr:pyridoxal phosphate-dependent transferase [Cercophora scortea]
MKDIQEFRLDTWIEGRQATIPLHGSAVSPLSLAELHKLAPEGTPGPVDQDLVLSYGDAQGTLKLRERLAELHSPDGPEEAKLTAANVIITPGSIMANYLALTSLVGPGDHFICQYPTFPQLWVVPRFQGAEVSPWRLRRGETSWEASLDELRGLVKENTKVIIINNPNNPTGAVLPSSTLHSLISLASEHNITLYSDEVFRPLFHSPTSPIPPPFVSLGYANSLSTGSLSKALGLPGVRVGWIVARDPALLARITNARYYTTISVSQLDEGVAAFALSPAVLPRIVARSLDICGRSIALLRDFVERNGDRVQWIAPAGAGTAFVRILEAGSGGGAPVDDRAFAGRVFEETGVGIVPAGYCFEDGEDEELKGYVRIAIGNEERLREGLEGLEKALRSG